MRLEHPSTQHMGPHWAHSSTLYSTLSAPQVSWQTKGDLQSLSQPVCLRSTMTELSQLKNWTSQVWRWHNPWNSVLRAEDKHRLSSGGIQSFLTGQVLAAL